MAQAKFDIFVNIRSFVGQFSKGMRAADRNLQKFQGNLQKFEKTTGKTASAMTKLGMKFQQFISTFRMWALGLMFFGMAIQRVFMRILKTGVSTFTQIQESMGFAGSAIQQVSAMFKFLGYIVGSVINRYLTPLLPWIWKNVRAIKQWMEDNPKLTAKIILWGLAIGTVLAVIGMLVLGLGALLTFITKLVISVGYLYKAFMFLAGILAVVLGISLGWAVVILAAIVVLVAAIIFNWGHLRDILIEYFLMAWDKIKAIVLTVIAFWKGVFKLFTLDFKGAIESWKSIGQIWKDWWTSYKEHVSNITGWIIDDIKAVIQWAKDAWGWIKKVFSRGEDSSAPNRQFGGPIPSTGLYQLHAGEYVVPANKVNNFNGGISVGINTTGGVNGNQVAREILREIKRYTNVYID